MFVNKLSNVCHHPQIVHCQSQPSFLMLFSSSAVVPYTYICISSMYIYSCHFSVSQFSSVAQSCPTLCDPMNHSTPGLPVHHQPRSSLRLMSITLVMPSSHLILCHPLLLPPIPPSIRVFSSESTLRMRWPKYWEFQLQQQSFQRTPKTDLLQHGLVGSPCSPRDSQESSPTPQFKSINSSALSFLYSPTLTSVHDHRKNHSLDQMDLCWQSNISAFQHAVQVGHNFPSKE